MWTRISVAILMAGALAGQRPGMRPEPGQAAAGTGSIAGKVLDSAGNPVKRAVVGLETESRGARTGRAMTGDDGSYVIRELPKGKYWIVAEKAGFLRGAYRGRTAGRYGDPVEVGEGAAKTGIDITLAKQGVIAGRVLDDAGEPVERVMVQAIPVKRTAGGRGPGNVATTNDLGEFRLTRLTPGWYRLRAARTGEMIVDRQPGRAATAEAPTYFPGTIDEASAAPVQVGPGEERTGAEIRLQRSTVVRVAGKVTGELPEGRGARVMLRSAGEPRVGMMDFEGGAGMGPDGSFEFRNVRPGEYAIVALSMGRGGVKTVGRQPVVVGQQDLNGITVAAAAPPRVDGVLRADGEPPFAFGPMEIELRGPGGFGPPNAVRSDDKGAFSFAGVSRERQTLNVKTPAGMVVKDVYAAGQPLPSLEIDFSVVTGPLEIVLSNKPATITGTVEGTTAGSPRVAVWAVPDGEPLTVEAWKTRKVRVASDAAGFTFDSLRAGTYRVAALDGAESDALDDPSVWEKFRTRTATVKVGEGESAQVKVKLITLAELE